MKKILITLGAICTLGFSTQIMYAEKVKSIYLKNDKSKVAGRLLPTNAVEILEKKDGLVKFKIQGYSSDLSQNIIYYKDGARIIALAFAKSAKPDIKVEEKGKDGGWDKVSVIAYTNDDSLVGELEPLLKRAGDMYNQNCSMCHALHDVNHYSANQWPSLFKSMADRTPLEKDDHWSIIQYLQKTTTAK